MLPGYAEPSVPQACVLTWVTSGTRGFGFPRPLTQNSHLVQARASFLSLGNLFPSLQNGLYEVTHGECLADETSESPNPGLSPHRHHPRQGSANFLCKAKQQIFLALQPLQSVTPKFCSCLSKAATDNKQMGVFVFQ